MEAEFQLRATNAQIGAARAALFPRITLTGLLGVATGALGSLFTGGAFGWTAGANAAYTIFQGGAGHANLRLSEAQRNAAIASYQKTIQSAFREVSDSLVAYRKNQEFRAQQELLTAAAQDTTRLANVRYQGGVTSYLEVLDSDTRYFDAQLGLLQAELNERLALVQLYNALGGGWQQ
jgi:multidrug efflux system outer membrane protein